MCFARVPFCEVWGWMLWNFWGRGYESHLESRRLCFWISSFREKFHTWHLSLAKPRGLRRRKRKIWTLLEDACFHGNVEHVLVCMMTSHIHILLSRLFFWQDSASASTHYTWCSHISGSTWQESWVLETWENQQRTFTFILTSTLTLNRDPTVGLVLGAFSR